MSSLHVLGKGIKCEKVDSSLDNFGDFIVESHVSSFTMNEWSLNVNSKSVGSSDSTLET